MRGREKRHTTFTRASHTDSSPSIGALGTFASMQTSVKLMRELKNFNDHSQAFTNFELLLSKPNLPM